MSLDVAAEDLGGGLGAELVDQGNGFRADPSIDVLRRN